MKQLNLKDITMISGGNGDAATTIPGQPQITTEEVIQHIFKSVPKEMLIGFMAGAVTTYVGMNQGQFNFDKVNVDNMVKFMTPIMCPCAANAA